VSSSHSAKAPFILNMQSFLFYDYHLDCKHLWNMFARMMVGNGDSKHQKFCLRLLLKNPESFSLQMINGHNALTSGNYRYALGKATTRLKITRILIKVHITSIYLS
jgi:hypothetical protein